MGNTPDRTSDGEPLQDHESTNADAVANAVSECSPVAAAAAEDVSSVTGPVQYAGSSGHTADDLVIQTLARSECELLSEARELAADVSIYRELCRVALATVTRLTRVVAKLTETVRDLRRELLRYTSSQIGRGR